MASKLIISNPRLSFLQRITAVHFPGKTGTSPPVGTKVWLFITPSQPQGSVVHNGFNLPYGSMDLNYGVGGFVNPPPLTPLVVPSSGAGGYGWSGPDSTINAGFIAVMAYFVASTSSTFGGGYYGTLLQAQAALVAINSPAGSQNVTLVEATITPV